MTSEFSLVEGECNKQDMLRCEASILFMDVGSAEYKQI